MLTMQISKLLISIAVTFAATIALAQTNALKMPGVVTLIVPYPAGGASDITARILAEPIGRELNVPAIVENIAGASGGIAAQKTLNAQADGHLLYQGSQNELILPPITAKSPRFQPLDFDLVHLVTTTRIVLVVRRGLPVSNLEEFMKLSRANSAIEPLSYGSPGIGSLYHLVSDSMAKLAGVRYTHIPYKGSAPLMQDLMGDRIDFTVMAFSTTMLPAVQGGRYRIIATMSNDKPPELANLPSISDVPAFKDMSYASISGYYVRKGTPPAIRQVLNDAIGSAVTSPAVIKALEGDGRRVPSRMSLAEADLFYRTEIAKYQRMVKLTGFEAVD